MVCPHNKNLHHIMKAVYTGQQQLIVGVMQAVCMYVYIVCIKYIDYIVYRVHL